VTVPVTQAVGSWDSGSSTPEAARPGVLHTGFQLEIPLKMRSLSLSDHRMPKLTDGGAGLWEILRDRGPLQAASLIGSRTAGSLWPGRQVVADPSGLSDGIYSYTVDLDGNIRQFSLNAVWSGVIRVFMVHIH
jgi:hypothetical protein